MAEELYMPCQAAFRQLGGVLRGPGAPKRSFQVLGWLPGLHPGDDPEAALAERGWKSPKTSFGILFELDLTRFASIRGDLRPFEPVRAWQAHLLVVDTGPSREPRYLLGLRIESEQLADAPEVQRMDSDPPFQAGHGPQPKRHAFQQLLGRRSWHGA